MSAGDGKLLRSYNEWRVRVVAGGAARQSRTDGEEQIAEALRSGDRR